MRPVTSVVPKPLLPVGTRPLLQWCIAEALEGGFGQIGIVIPTPPPAALETYLGEDRWREGLPDSLESAAGRARLTIFHQPRPLGVVDAVLSAAEWLDDEAAAFAVFLPDNVRIAGLAGATPPITVAHLHEAASRDIPVVACHRIGPEARHAFANLGRAVLEELVPAGALPLVESLQERGPGVFRAPPEGAWRLMPRYTVTPAWLREARVVARRASLTGGEADDAEVHRRLIAARKLAAAPWTGTLVDAGHPAGYLYAHHLLYEAGERAREQADGNQAPPGDLLQIEMGT